MSSSLGDVLDAAIRKCPFLSQVAATQGEDYAKSIAANPTRPAPVLPESLADFRASFTLFHGASGVVPLVQTTGSEHKRCPYSHKAASQSSSEGRCRRGQTCTVPDASPQLATLAPLSTAPFASLSSGVFRFLPGPGDFIALRRQRRQKRQERRAERQRKAQQAKRASTQSQHLKLEKWRTHPIAGGLIPFNAAGRYVCPPFVVAGRQAVAKLKSVQLLRPQVLPVKLLGVGGHCLAANIPCGAIREHTEKFSVAWFVAVHATVPFFAFMRKGVGMPKWGIALTLGAAVAGQAIGARLERIRLAAEAAAKEQRELQTRSLLLEEAVDVRRGCPVLRACGEISQNTGTEATIQPSLLSTCSRGVAVS